MRFYCFIAGFLVLSAPAQADIVFTERTLRAQTIIESDDIQVREGRTLQGVISDPTLVIGMETRRAIYAGRPIRNSDIGPPALVDRNQIVPLIFDNGAIQIATEGRALERAGAGEIIRVMNLGSRTIVNGRVSEGGSVHVSN